MIPENLIKKIQNKKAFYEKANFKDLFSWDSLNDILNLRPFINSTRFHVLTEGNFTWDKQAWLSEMNSFPPKLLHDIINKHSCYISDASRVNKNVNSVCEDLENILGYPTDAHIYFSASDDCSQGFPIHWDWSHNLIIQIEGKTNFKVWDIIADTNSNRLINSLPSKPALDIIMEPGDVIFVPEKVYHQASSLTKRMSISFPSSPYEKLAPQERYWINIGG